MTILGIETSCDETSAAIVRDGRLISNITAVQLIHTRFGGVVPELASRAHQRLIVPVVDEALSKAAVKTSGLSAVAAVHGPGLIGSILVGLSFGKAMALGLGIPFVGVNHMEGHVFSNLIEEPKPGFPFLNLTVSGGHTQLVLVKEPFDCEILGETIDDAAGEAFDKVAKMLGVGYPGGPIIDTLAAQGNPKAIDFPRSFLGEDSLEFSFSGLKTSVLYYLRRSGYVPGERLQEKEFVADVCASFQSAVIDVLIHKLFMAAEKKGVANVAIAGGVSANSELRRRATEGARSRQINLFIPRFEYCTDNGAMIAMAGYYRMVRGMSSTLEMTAEPGLSLENQQATDLG